MAGYFSRVADTIDEVCLDIGSSERIEGRTPVQRMTKLNALVLARTIGTVPEPVHNMYRYSFGVISGTVYRAAEVFRGDSVPRFVAGIADERTDDFVFQPLSRSTNRHAVAVETYYGLSIDDIRETPWIQLTHHEQGTRSFFALDEHNRDLLIALGKNRSGCPFREYAGRVAISVAEAAAGQGIIESVITASE